MERRLAAILVADMVGYSRLSLPKTPSASVLGRILQPFQLNVVQDESFEGLSHERPRFSQLNEALSIAPALQTPSCVECAWGSSAAARWQQQTRCH